MTTKATGYTYDKTVHTVKAVVADNGDGTLRVTTSVSKQVDGEDELEGQWIYPSNATSAGVATVKFKNTYTVTEAATLYSVCDKGGCRCRCSGPSSPLP